MEAYLQIAFLNDFIFCPLSIYFHQLYGNTSEQLYYDTPQLEGRAAHAAVDEKRYSTHKAVLQGIDVYSECYGLCGKIDVFDAEKQLLTERKKKITAIYDGYVFQLYAQYFCLIEMGYTVKNIRFYSVDTNKVFPIRLPEDDALMFQKFTQVIADIASFDADSFVPRNAAKCTRCIYCNLCDRPLA
jgi:CRISPR-associated protein Cas4